MLQNATCDIHGYQLFKVIFYESEADKINHRVMAIVFDSDADLSYKNQLRHFVLHIDSIADIAEDVADKIAIFALKHAIRPRARRGAHGDRRP